MRRLERGASYIPLIIVLVLLVVAVVWAYVKTDESDQLRAQLMQAEQKSEQFDESRRKTLIYLQDVARVTGFGIETPTEDMIVDYRVDHTAIQNFVAQAVRDLETKYIRQFPTNVYTFAEDGGIRREESDGKVTVGYLAMGSVPSELTLQSLYQYMESAMQRMLADVTRLVNDRSRQESEFARIRRGFEDTIRDKDATIARLQEEKNAVETAKAQMEQAKNQEISDAEDRARGAEEALAQAEAAHRTAVQEMSAQISGLENSVQRLKVRQGAREQPIGPDGEVLSVTADMGLAFINRGKSDHLLPGTTFDVYTLGKGAQKVAKGSIVILDVEENRARARILDLADPSRPIVQGDLIESLTYNPGEQLHFHFLGRTRKYGKSDAMARVRQLGQAVDATVGIDTDYLVLGEPEGDEDLRETEAYKRAQELGVRVITEAQLSQFLNY